MSSSDASLNGEAVAPEEMERDELEAEVAELRRTQSELLERLEAVEEHLENRPIMEFRGSTANYGNLFVGNHPVGRILFNTRERSQNNEERLDHVGEDNSGGMAGDVRSHLMPAHKRYIDLREGDTIDQVDKRRAAILFGQVVKYVTGQSSMVGVNAEYGNIKMTSTDAIRSLEDAGEMTDTGKSTIAKRAMKRLHRMTNTVDCQCDTIHECRHALLAFDDSAKENKLVGDEERVRDYFADVEAALTEDVTTADDSGSSDEDRGDDAEDNEVANSVVSDHDDAVLSGDYETDRGDTTR